MLVSIIIKALNEERHIARAIESALAALANRAGEVVLADSGSTDRTVEIARAYPIRIAQLADARERNCGVAAQLGFQHSTGEFVCLMDGDMALDPAFIDLAVDFLVAHPKAAGVAGRVEEMNLANLEFVRRVSRRPADLNPGEVDRLNGGGLYRRSAIVSVAYFSDRNLHGYEEYDLAVRLRAAGWTLHRLDCPFVRHWGHHVGAYRLLWRRLTSGYIYGIGEVVRAALGRPHLAQALADLREVRLWLLVLGSWLVALAGIFLMPDWTSALLLIVAVLVLPVVPMAVRYGSLDTGAYAVVAWHAHALGFLLGFLRSRVDPTLAIASRVIPGGTRGQTQERALDGA